MRKHSSALLSPSPELLLYLTGEHLALITNEPAPQPKRYHHRAAQPATTGNESRQLYRAVYELCYCVAGVTVFVVVHIKVVNNFNKESHRAPWITCSGLHCVYAVLYSSRFTVTDFAHTQTHAYALIWTKAYTVCFISISYFPFSGLGEAGSYGIFLPHFAPPTGFYVYLYVYTYTRVWRVCAGVSLCRCIAFEN